MKYLLIPLNIILAYFVYNSINGEVEFNKDAEIRITENVQKLKDLRQLQVKYKQNKGVFANNFESLISFLENDSIYITYAIGQTPDSLTEAEALNLGIISRKDSAFPAQDIVFDSTYRSNRNDFPLELSELTNVPHSKDPETGVPIKYNIEAGQIKKGNVTVQVFEISTTYESIFKGLDSENRGYELENILKVGSMDEASLNGNWGE